MEQSKTKRMANARVYRIEKDSMNHCCICTKNIIGTTWFCNGCAKLYKLVGKKSYEWPDWIKALRNFEQQDRRRRKDELESGFTVFHYGTFEDLEDLVNERYDIEH
jgi:hypothetical protein